MSKLQNFLNRNTAVNDQTTEVSVSNRFIDDDGQILKFKIKAIPMNTYKSIQNECIKTNKKGVIETDTTAIQEKLVIEGTVDPNFKDADSIKSAGCILPEQYLNKVLLIGEIVKLSGEIMTLSGFNNSMDDLVEEAKN
jgi:hypothetical protein